MLITSDQKTKFRLIVSPIFILLIGILGVVFSKNSLILIAFVPISIYLGSIIFRTIANPAKTFEITNSQQMIYDGKKYPYAVYDYLYAEFFLGVRHVPFLVIEDKATLRLQNREKTDDFIKIDCSVYSHENRNKIIRAISYNKTLRE